MIKIFIPIPIVVLAICYILGMCYMFYKIDKKLREKNEL